MKSKINIKDKTLDNLGFESLNEIQEAVLKAGLENHIILHAPTGSGKTVAYLMPLLQFLNKDAEGVQAIVIVPSRELALQIEQVFRKMNTGFKVNSCYGGHLMRTERNNFTEAPALLIGTPGRLADHLQRGSFNPETIGMVVLDEFDKSLEMGYSEEMSYITGRLTKARKRILTSATRSIEIPEFTGISNPVVLDFPESEHHPKITLNAVRSKEKDKLEVLRRLICQLGNEATLIFCNHREAVERISDLLHESNLVHDTFHGGLEQDERERALVKFRNGSHNILVTTDLAARGLDIPEIRHIIHYQMPATATVFTHRNGRTARMKAEGTAWLVLSETEPLPSFIDEKPVFIDLQDDLTPPQPPEWVTLYIGGGKKDKISKTDIVGFLIQQGRLQKEEIGLIVVQDFVSFAAVNRKKVHKALVQLKKQKLKGKKVKVEIAL